MNTELSMDQILSYRENGFVVLEEFLTPDELETWRDAVSEAVNERGNMRFPHQEAGGEGYYNNVFIQRVNLWQTNEKVKRLMLDRNIGRLAAELEGVDGIRVWHDQALIKESWGNPTSWHLDCPYWSFDSVHAISIWIALDDATLQNGCLYFIPGSHKKQCFDNVGIGPNMGDLFKVYPEFRDKQPVAAPMKAGSCSFHNGLTAHAAGANMTPGYRRAMTCAFMPDGCTFNGKPNILTPEQLAKLKIGDPMSDEQQNPLIYAASR